MKEKMTALLDEYGINSKAISRCSLGVGGESYFVEDENEKYFLKIVKPDATNHPANEHKICEFLHAKGIPVPKYLRNKHGCYTTALDDGRVYHLQRFLEGKTYPVHMAPDWLLKASAEALGKIHLALEEYPALPEGMGKGFFQYMNVNRAIKAYRNTLDQAKEQGLPTIVDDLQYRIALLEHFPDLSFQLEDLTCKNTHGDFTINQLLCGEKTINGIVDWTCACVHPVVWEISRSFLYACPESRYGKIDRDKFDQYVLNYSQFIELNDYDRENLFKLYYYQLAVCDYYGQALSARDSDQKEFLWQARFATSVLRENEDCLKR